MTMQSTELLSQVHLPLILIPVTSSHLVWNTVSETFLMIRAAYGLENIKKGATSTENETAAILFNSDSFFSGPAVGATAVIPFTKERKNHKIGPRMYIDYAYRFTNKWRGNHYIGIKIAL